MSTPIWKKNFILIFGLFENLIFSGTILGWSALNYMLKSEGVYRDICEDVKPHFEINDYNINNYSIIQRNSISMQNNSENTNVINTLNNAVINLILTDSHNETNVTFLEELEAYNMEPRFSTIYVSNIFVFNLFKYI